MKLSRKVIAGFSAAALLAMAGTFFSCKSDDEDPYELITVDGDNATIDASNDGTATISDDTKVANDTTFVRGFKTPKSTAWKAAVYKLTINKNSKGGVLGFVFDEESYEAGTERSGTGHTAGTRDEKEYDFYLLGVRAGENAPTIYLSRFNDVTQSGLSGSGTSFGTEYTMIDSGETSPASGSKWYYQLGDSFKYINEEASLYVVVKQPSAAAGYSFGLFATQDDATNWYNNNGESAKDGTSPTNILTNFNAVNGNTFLNKYKGDTYTPSLSNFNVESTKDKYRDRQIGFYAMIPRGGNVKGSWTKIDNKLADEVVEE